MWRVTPNSSVKRSTMQNPKQKSAVPLGQPPQCAVDSVAQRLCPVFSAALRLHPVPHRHNLLGLTRHASRPPTAAAEFGSQPLFIQAMRSSVPKRPAAPVLCAVCAMVLVAFRVLALLQAAAAGSGWVWVQRAKSAMRITWRSSGQSNAALWPAD